MWGRLALKAFFLILIVHLVGFLLSTRAHAGDLYGRPYAVPASEEEGWEEHYGYFGGVPFPVTREAQVAWLAAEIDDGLGSLWYKVAYPSEDLGFLCMDPTIHTWEFAEEHQQSL